MANVIAPAKLEALLAHFNSGASLRAASKAVGISTNTAKRYMPRDVVRLCPCGGPAGHKGWCKHRFSLSTARQAYHMSRRVIKSRKHRTRRTFVLVYPFLTETRTGPGYDLLTRVNAACPPYDYAVRGDICQEAIASILSGEFTEDNIRGAIKDASKRVFGQMNALSLDVVIPGSKVRYVDMLTDEDSIWRLAA